MRCDMEPIRLHAAAVKNMKDTGLLSTNTRVDKLGRCAVGHQYPLCAHHMV